MAASMPHFRPVDFQQIVAEMSAGKAFDDYAKPLGKTKASDLDSSFKNPAFPGDGCYGNGPAVIARWDIKLPNDLIAAQSNSNKDAIRLYMPEKKMGEWMHEYFSGDFMASASFRKLVTSLNFPKVRKFGNWTNTLDDSLSMKFDNPQRSRNDRKMYTATEIKLTAKICKEMPALLLTVIAYQASYMEYLDRLGAAMESSSLSNAQKVRGDKIIKHLSDNWSNENFINNILPAVALHYYQNHMGNIGEKPTENDFTMGMRFAVEKGMFNNVATPPDGKPRQFTCPAKGILTRMSALAMGHEASGAIQPENAVEAAVEARGMNIGVGLFHIYREVEKTLERGSHAVARILDDIDSMIDRSLIERE